MPTYLCHGFRWQRRSVRVYVVVQDLDDASPEWIIAPKSSQCLLESFYNLFDFLPYCAPPSRSSARRHDSVDASDDDSHVLRSRNHSNDRRSRSQSFSRSRESRSQNRSRSRSLLQTNPPQLPPVLGSAPPEDDVRSQDWSLIKLLEEYDPMNLDEVSRPYAYVADYVVRVDLSVSIADEMQQYEERLRADRAPPMTGPASDETGRKKHNKKPGWLEKLRDQLQRGEDIKWYVVTNGDEVREWPDEPIRRTGSTQRPTATRQQQQHHAQYSHQQVIFEANNAAARPQLRGGRDLKDVPPLNPPKMSTDDGPRPKTSSKGGFRKLFGKSKPDDHSP